MKISPFEVTFRSLSQLPISFVSLCILRLYFYWSLHDRQYPLIGFHTYNREDLAKTNLQKSQEMKVSSIWKIRRKTWCSQDIGVGSLQENGKMFIGCQQWRHTRRSSYLCQKQRIQIRTSKRISTQNNNEKIVLTSSSTIFSSNVSKDENQWQSLRSASHDFKDKIFNTVGMATAASRRP